MAVTVARGPKRLVPFKDRYARVKARHTASCERRGCKKRTNVHELSPKVLSCESSSLPTPDGNMTSSRRNACYCRNSLTSSGGKDDQSTTPRGSARPERAGKENRGTPRYRRIISSKSSGRKESLPISPPTPVLSPETRAALKNAEEIFQNAQQQIREASLLPGSISMRGTGKRYVDDPPFDDENEQLFYIRELVASTIYEHQNEKSIDAKKENFEERREGKIQIPRPTERKFKFFPRRGESKSSFPAEKREEIKHPRNGKSFPYQSPVDDKSTDPASGKSGKSSVKNSSSKTEVTPKTCRTDGSSKIQRNFQIQSGPAVHIERKLSVRYLENVHISPDVSFRQSNDNVGNFHFRHESCVESTAREKQVPEKSTTQMREENGENNQRQNREIEAEAEGRDEKVEIIGENCQDKIAKEIDENVKINQNIENAMGNTGILKEGLEKGELRNVSLEGKNNDEKEQIDQKMIGENISKLASVEDKSVKVPQNGINNPLAMREKRVEYPSKVDLITCFIDSFDLDVSQAQDTQEHSSQEKSLIKERNRMIDLRLKDIHRRFYGEENVMVNSESCYSNSYFTNTSEENSEKCFFETIDDISLNKLPLSDFDEILIAYDKVIRQLNCDVNKVTEFFRQREVQEANKFVNLEAANNDKAVASTSRNKADNKIIENPRTKFTSIKECEKQVRNENGPENHFSPKQSRRALFSSITQTKNASRSINNCNNNSNVVNESNFSSSLTESHDSKENSQSVLCNMEENLRSCFSSDKPENTDNKKNMNDECFKGENFIQESTITDCSVPEFSAKEYTTNDLYKAGFPDDNDEGVHVTKSNETTNPQNLIESQKTSVLAYTSDFSSSGNSRSETLKYSKTSSSSYHLGTLMARFSQSESAESENKIETRRDSSSKGSNKFHEDNITLKCSKIKSSKETNEKQFKSKEQESNVTNAVEINCSTRNAVNSKSLEPEVEDLQVAISLEREEIKSIEIPPIDDKVNITNNLVIEHKQNLLNNTTSTIKTSDLISSTLRNSNVSEKPSIIVSTKGSNYCRHLQTGSKAEESPGRLSSEEDSLRDCTSLQSSMACAENGKISAGIVRCDDPDFVESRKNESDGDCKDLRGDKSRDKFATLYMGEGKNMEEEVFPRSLMVKKAAVTNFSGSSFLTNPSSRSSSSTSMRQSNTRSEGELFMPSSCSYSLGEIRIFGKNSEEEIFLTRSMRTSFNDVESSTTESFGEIRSRRGEF